MSAAAVFLLAAGCSVAQTPDPTATAAPSAATSAASSVAGRVTLEEDGCTFSTGEAVEADGAFTIEVSNMTSRDSGFDLYLLRDDASYEDWVAFHEAVQDSFDDGSEPEGSPSDLADPVDLQVAVPAGGSGVLTEERARDGTYALQCWIFAGDDDTTIMTAGPMPVGPPS
jgi:hypothetical protein